MTPRYEQLPHVMQYLRDALGYQLLFYYYRQITTRRGMIGRITWCTALMVSAMAVRRVPRDNPVISVDAPDLARFEFVRARSVDLFGVLPGGTTDLIYMGRIWPPDAQRFSKKDRRYGFHFQRKGEGGGTSKCFALKLTPPPLHAWKRGAERSKAGEGSDVTVGD